MNIQPNKMQTLYESDCAPSAWGCLLPAWNILRSHAAAVMEKWRSGETEDAVQRNGAVMSDSLERDITALVFRSRGL